MRPQHVSCRACLANNHSRVFWRQMSCPCCRTCWVLFYIIEAVAVYSVINKYPNDADAAVRAWPDFAVWPL